MDIEQQYKNTLEKLSKHNQKHLLKFWDELDDISKAELLVQIEKLNFEEIDRWVEKYVKKDQPVDVPKNFEPAPSYPANPQNPEEKELYNKARRLGTELISAGKTAAFTVAGGQGTRLGFDGPKGNFPVSPVKNKTLFRIFSEIILAASKKYGTAFKWYIMTSPLNNAETIDTFRKNNYFGLDADQLFIFQQGTNPNFSFDGKILLSEKDSIAKSPDGHGGSLKALYQSGAIDDMKSRGIEWISYFQVDNPLINIFDPLFIGLTAMNNSQMSSKALKKVSAKEKVGNFCLADAHVTVIEYSDLPDELAEKTNPDGSLVFELGSIAIHIISVDFVEKLNSKGFALPIHKAIKKIPCIDANGKHIKPEKPNGVKLETFVFDALPMADNSIILETVRSEEFSPVKNASGSDSPETCRNDMIALHADWLENAGVKIPTQDGKVNCKVEISPSFALTKQDVIERKSELPQKIEPGSKFYIE